MALSLSSSLHSAHSDTQSGPIALEEFLVASVPNVPGRDLYSGAATDGHYVVWTTTSGGVYAYDLVETRAFTVSELPGIGAAAPQVDNGIVVWNDDRNGNLDVFGYDLKDGREFQVTSGPADEVLPTVSGSIVIWQENQPWDRNLYGKDLGTGSEFSLAKDRTGPRVSGNSLVYVKGNAKSGVRVYAMRLDFRTETQIADVPPAGCCFSYDVSNGVAVVSGPGKAYAIALHDLTSTPLPARYSPVPILVDRDWVVWTDAYAGLSTTHIFDLHTGRDFAKETKWKAVAFKGDVIVGIRAEGQRMDIYAARIRRLLDYPLPSGHFYTQANGQPPEGGLGYPVTNDNTIPFWEEFQRLGGVPALGYPVSQRFTYKGFTTQAFQKGVMQWQAGEGRESGVEGRVFFVNVFDELHQAGKDDWLLAFRATPRQLDPSFDAAKTWEEIVRDRLALLEANPAIKDRYFSTLDSATLDPLSLYGLPTSRVEDMGNHYAIRLQRAAIQQWKVDVPWAKAGEVTVANGGDMAKEAGVFPAEALVPEAPP